MPMHHKIIEINQKDDLEIKRYYYFCKWYTIARYNSETASDDL